MKLGVYQVVNLRGHIEKGKYGNQAVVQGDIVQRHHAGDWTEESGRLSLFMDIAGDFREYTMRDLQELGFNGDFRNMEFAAKDALFEVYKNKNGKEKTRLYREPKERNFDIPDDDDMTAIQQWWDSENPTPPTKAAAAAYDDADGE